MTGLPRFLEDDNADMEKNHILDYAASEVLFNKIHGDRKVTS